MSEDKYKEDLKDIRDLMNRSSRFISLSGMSGVCAGVFSLIGAYAAYQTIYAGQDYFSYRIAHLNPSTLLTLLGIAASVIILSIVTCIYFTTKRARKLNQKLWDVHSKRFLVNLLIPLATCGILCFILLINGYVGVVAPLTLIFYGLALVNGSHYTLKETRGLGLAEIILGLLGTYFIGYGLLFWAIGFGVSHIIYGGYMHFKHSK